MLHRKLIGSTLATMGAVALVGFYSSYHKSSYKQALHASANSELSEVRQHSDFKWAVMKNVGLLAIGLTTLGAGGYLLIRQRHKAHRIILDFTNGINKTVTSKNDG